MKRRFFLFAAPAIVAAPSLMKVSALVVPEGFTYDAASKAAFLARADWLIAYLEMSNEPWVEVARIGLNSA